MKIKNILVALIAFMLLVTFAHSQVTHFGTTRSTGDIVGFTSAINYGPLNIKNNINNSGTTYDIDFYIDAAYPGMMQLPIDVQPGVYTAFIYYRELLTKIQRVPESRVKQNRIRVPDFEKLILLGRTITKFKLNLF